MADELGGGWVGGYIIPPNPLKSLSLPKNYAPVPP